MTMLQNFNGLISKLYLWIFVENSTWISYSNILLCTSEEVSKRTRWKRLILTICHLSPEYFQLLKSSIYQSNESRPKSALITRKFKNIFRSKLENYPTNSSKTGSCKKHGNFLSSLLKTAFNFVKVKSDIVSLSSSTEHRIKAQVNFCMKQNIF